MEPELRRLARQYLRRERPGHVLQTTALVNEAFIRLMNWKDVSWQNRGHFLAMVARLMRHILVDISRRRAKDDDGREIRIVHLGEANGVTVEPSRELLALDAALRELAEHDPRKAQIVEMARGIPRATREGRWHERSSARHILPTWTGSDWRAILPARHPIPPTENLATTAGSGIMPAHR